MRRLEKIIDITGVTVLANKNRLKIYRRGLEDINATTDVTLTPNRKR
jgi:hypothetical protein